VAPETLAQVLLFNDDCHWYVKPPAVVTPESDNVKLVAAVPEVGEAEDVPAEGVAEHAAAPVPVTGIL
jgi:hypothetical protein